MAVLCVFGIFNYLQTKQIAMLCLVVLGCIITLNFLFIGIRSTFLLVSDFICVRKDIIKKTTGIVVSIKAEKQGGDPPTTRYYPIIKDENTGDEIKLDIAELKMEESIKRNRRYSFLYLPNTKLAVLDENFSYITVGEKDVNNSLTSD